MLWATCNADDAALQQYRLRAHEAQKRWDTLEGELRKRTREMAAALSEQADCQKKAVPPSQCNRGEDAQKRITATKLEIDRLEAELVDATKEVHFVEASAPPELIRFRAESEFYRTCMPLYAELACKEKLKQWMRSWQ